LKKTSQRTLGFFTVPAGPTAAIHLKKDDFLSEEWGAPHGCLNRNVTEQKLNLFEFTSGSMAKPSTGSTAMPRSA